MFGPLGFVSFIEDVVDLIDRHSVRSPLHADDTQYYDSCRRNDTESLRSRLSDCASDVDLWCRARRLLLNANKSEAIGSSSSNLTKLSTVSCSIQVDTHILYGIEIYGNTSNVHLKKLITLNNKLLCILQNKPNKFPVNIYMLILILWPFLNYILNSC